MIDDLNFRMLVYDCCSAGYRVGFIEVMQNSSTVFKIQTDGGAKGRYQIDTNLLYKWICSKTSPEKYYFHPSIVPIIKS